MSSKETNHEETAMPTITDTITETDPTTIARRAALVAAYLARQEARIRRICDDRPAITARLSMILPRPVIAR